MAKRIRSIRDEIRHRRIAHSSPLARIPEDALIRRDVYHSAPPRAGRLVGSGAGEGSPDLVGAT